MTDISPERLMGALMKEPALFRGFIRQLTRVLVYWQRFSSGDREWWQRHFFYQDNKMHPVVHVYEEAGIWKWHHNSSSLFKETDWGAARTREEAMEAADQWAEEHGYYLMQEES